MRRVVIESPYAGDVAENVRYARAALVDSLSRGEAPLASHLLYTQPGVLDDKAPEQRKLGIAAGLEWMRLAEAVVVYDDNGLSRGMIDAIVHAEWLGITVEYRSLYGKTSSNSDTIRT